MEINNENQDPNAQGADSTNTPPAEETINNISETEAPGTGIDTDGDGNANLVTQDDAEPVHVDHEDDYKNKVRLSDNIGDAVNKKTAKKLVKDSNINKHFQDIMIKQINDGQLKHPYNEAFKRVSAAAEGGSVYRPGSDGL